MHTWPFIFRVTLRSTNLVISDHMGVTTDSLIWGLNIICSSTEYLVSFPASHL